MEKSQCDQWLDSQMKGYEPLWDDLRTIQGRYPSFLAVLKELAPFAPNLNRIYSEVKAVEKQCGLTLEPQNLEGWIKNATEHLRGGIQQCLDAYTSCGIDTSKITLGNLQNHALLQASPVGQKLQHIWGPRWFTQLEEINAYTEHINSNRLEESKFMALINMRTEHVCKSWETLRNSNLCGEVADFQEQWAHVSTETRIMWLKQLEFKLPEEPNSDIYAWFQAMGPENVDHRSQRLLFLTPALNLEQLSQDDMLPRLLEQRASEHPEAFRTIDGSSINLGLWCRCLTPISTEGLLSFAPQTVDYYSVSIIRETDSSGAVRQTPTNSEEALPCLGIYHLEAQQRIYAFLAKCLKVPLNASSGDPIAKSELSILAQSARLEYQSQQRIVNIDFLDDIVQSSLEEVLDNLCRLRTDPEYWVKCMMWTDAKPPGRVHNFLKGVFDRISTFSALAKSIRSLRDCGTFANSGLATTAVLPDHNSIQMLRSLHNDFSSLLEEGLSQLTSLVNAIPRTKDPFFSWLFDILRTNNPSLRTVGIPAVLTAIDRQLEHLGTQDSGLVSVTAERLLNDMSVFCVGYRESFKHWNFVTEYHSDLRTEVFNPDQKHKLYPWGLLIENTLAMLSHDECHKLQVHIHKDDVEAAKRHHTFWTLIDEHMLAACQDNPSLRAVYDYIQQAAPLQDIQIHPAHAVPIFGDESEPTATQMKRSKGRKTIVDYGSDFVPMDKYPDIQPPPPIRPVRDLEFWKALVSPSSQNRSDLDWDDFCRAMQGIGYVLRRQGGSGRRFEQPSGNVKLGAMVFHEPHGTGKVTHSTAQREWLRRIRKRFEIRFE